MIFFNMLPRTIVKFQIFYTVVCSIMIDMMNNFLFRKYASNMLLHNVTMLAIISFNTYIRMVGEIYPFITVPTHHFFDSRLCAAFIATKKSRYVYSFWNKNFITYFTMLFLSYYCSFFLKFKGAFSRTMFLINRWKSMKDYIAVGTGFVYQS